MAIVVSLITVLFTFLGGALALRSKNKQHLVLGLSGGLLLGLVSFDLIPEVLELSSSELLHTPAVMVAFVAGFLVLHIIERSSGLHEHTESEYDNDHTHNHGKTGTIAALAMAGHVFLDGVGIGLAFQVSNTLGWTVAIALITHAFTDGLNTVSFLIHNGTWKKRAIWLLGVDAIARMSGAILGTKLAISDAFLGMYLALFAGFLIYLATSHILPAAHSKKPARSTLAMTILGVIMMFALVNLLHE